MEYTPMLRQYLQIKQNYQDAILFFRLGDFYEMFFEDAEVASRELEIVLTARDGGKGIKVPMCGVPHHAAESYLVRLIEKNYKVAVCEQVELPGESKGIVRREVTRVVTPGTIMAGQALEDKTHNYLIAVVPVDDVIGMACTDVTTGHFMVTSFSGSSANESLFDELIRLRPKEVLIPRKDILKGLENKEFLVTIIESRTCELSRAKRILYRHYGERWKVTGINHCTGMICAAGALLTYLYDTQKHELAQIRDINIYSTGHFMMLDAVTRRNLEITESIIDGGRQGTLFSVLDHSCTAMGARMLRGWLEQPLMDLTEINRRLDGVEALNKNIFLRESLRKLLVPVYDLERLGGRVAAGAANPKDMVCLRQSLALIPQIKELLINEETEYLKDIAVQMDILGDIYQLLDKAIVDQPPLLLREGGIIKPGYSEEIDRLRQASTDYKAWLAEMETAEKQRTGIKSLKIGYNKVFGYYIEITRSNLDQVPDDYIRKQTLVNAERFITPRLKEYEELIINAQDKLAQLEYRLFCYIRDKVLKALPRLQHTAKLIAMIDTLQSLSEVASRKNYVRPVLTDNSELSIKDGRHPVVEVMLGTGEFVPNDTCVDSEEYLSLITGPNMAGKSTYMRQVALIVLMAQAGGFVPAGEARIGLVDRIFTRVGAADDLAGGRSTFMVEMYECRTILEYATEKSLIIMDEVGRGTSTYDGISLARAMIEYIHDMIRARTFFSTHYHELTDLENLPGVKNYTMVVQEQGEKIVFLRKLKPGKADRSYGIQVAGLAGIPEPVLERARQFLTLLEENHKGNEQIVVPKEASACYDCRENIYNKIYSIIKNLNELDVNKLTPLEALNYIANLQKELNLENNDNQ